MRAAGLMGNTFTYADVLSTYEEALVEHEQHEESMRRQLSPAWAARLNKEVAVEVR